MTTADEPSGTPIADELTALVRQWMRASEAVAPQSSSADEADRADDAPLTEDAPLTDDAPPADDAPPVEEAQRAEAPRPPLPRRQRRPHPSSAASDSQPQLVIPSRLAVLIDAESTSADSAAELFEALSDHGTLSVCRAYADWTSPAARDWWSAPLRRHGIQPCHQFSEDADRRSLVALTIDAVDLARDSTVDAVAIVGDIASLHPLIVRLKAAGLPVLGFGTTPTPEDVRDGCHEFVDLSQAQGDQEPAYSGKHRG